MNACRGRDMIMRGRVHTQTDRDDWTERVRPSRRTFSVDICHFWTMCRSEITSLALGTHLTHYPKLMDYTSRGASDPRHSVEIRHRMCCLAALKKEDRWESSMKKTYCASCGMPEKHHADMHTQKQRCQMKGKTIRTCASPFAASCCRNSSFPHSGAGKLA